MLLEIFSSIIISFLGLLFSLFYVFVDSLEEDNWKKLLLIFSFIFIFHEIGIIGFCVICSLEVIMYYFDLFNKMEKNIY